MDDEAVVDWKGLKEQFGWPYSRTHTWHHRNLFLSCFARNFKRAATSFGDDRKRDFAKVRRCRVQPRRV
jgi:hypothetical protein